MVDEYKVRSGFKYNPWAIQKLSGLQLCTFICQCYADPSTAAILPPHCWILIQMYSPRLSVPDVGAPSDTVVNFYSLVCVLSLNMVCWLLRIAKQAKMLQGDGCQGWGIDQPLVKWRRSQVKSIFNRSLVTDIVIEFFVLKYSCFPNTMYRLLIFPQPQLTSSNCLCCPTNSQKPKGVSTSINLVRFLDSTTNVVH